MAAPAGDELADFGMGASLTSLRVANSRLDLLEMPFLHVEVGTDSFLQQVAAIPIKNTSEGIEGIDLV
jgi:hypothetical protein